MPKVWWLPFWDTVYDRLYHCTVPFTLVYAEKKQDRRQMKRLLIKKLNTTQKKQTTQNTAKQN